MTRFASVLVCSALLVACQSSDTPTAPADPGLAAQSAVIHTKQRDELVVDATIENPCNGELIAMQFRELFILHDLVIEGKSFHSHIVSVDRGTTGVGLTSGARYRQVGVQESSAFFKGSAQQVKTFTITGGIIGQGKAPDFHAHETFHLTVTPQGKASVEFDRFRFECR